MILLEQSGNLLCSGFDQGNWGRPHKRVMKIGYAAESTVCNQLLDLVNWKHDIHVLLKSRAIEIDRQMTHDELVAADVAGKNYHRQTRQARVVWRSREPVKAAVLIGLRWVIRPTAEGHR